MIKKTFKISKMKKLIIIFILIVFQSCANTPEQKYAYALKKSNSTSFNERPDFYQKMLNKGFIDQKSFDLWMKEWRQQNEEARKEHLAFLKAQEKLRQQHAKWIASLSPAQRLDLEMREREIQVQYARINSEQIQQSQVIDSYNERTRSMSQPTNVNVNVSGSIDHQVQGTIYHKPVNKNPGQHLLGSGFDASQSYVNPYIQH